MDPNENLKRQRESAAALRRELEAECISLGELSEIDNLAATLGVTVTDEMMASDTLDEIDNKLMAP